MFKINLLPWREELKLKRQYLFIIGIAGLLLVLLVPIFFGQSALLKNSQQLKSQNYLLEQKLKALTQNYLANLKLKKQEKQLAQKEQVLKKLQAKQQKISRLLPTLSEIIPTKLYFTDLKVKDDAVRISGSALARTSILTLATNIEQSDYLIEPVIVTIQGKSATALHEASNFVYDGMYLALAEMLHSGTTCFQEHYLFPNVIAEATKVAKARACIGMFVVDAKTPWATDLEDCFKKGMDFYHHYKNENLVKVNLAPHAPYSLDDAALVRIKELAQELQVPIQMHVHESIDEVEQSIKQYGKRAVQRLYDLGLFELPLQAVHMVQLNDEDLALLKVSPKVSVIHCPDSNLKLANGFCPTQKLFNQGTNVALGTDGPASNNDLDMFAEMRTAALIAKGFTGDPTAMPAATALRMATLNSAYAMGLDKEIGSIEIGKAADLIAVDLANFFTQPVYNPISHLVYAVNSRQVTDVWVAGQRLLAYGHLTTLNEDEVLAKAKAWGKRIAAKG